MLTVEEIDKSFCVDFVHAYHYSKVMPVHTKHYLGIYTDDALVGVLTLGWGTQPKATINKLFPGHDSSHYYEIGKMCMTPQYNESRGKGNWGSRTVSAVVKWMKQNTDRKFLYTLADGIVGKVGFVYQASNFYYGGYFWTSVYMGEDGEKIHPRTTKWLCKENYRWLGDHELPTTDTQNKRGQVFWLTHDFMESKGIRRINGKMFRYIYPLNKKARKIVERSGWSREYPKDKNLEWKQQVGKGVYVKIEAPDFALDIVNFNKKNVERNR
jgi:hypothetical protein